jgi:hypothetical protein
MSAEEDELYSEYDQIPSHGDEPASNTPTKTDFPAFLADDSNVRSRRRSQFFREGEAAGALDNGTQDPRSPPDNKGMLTTDVGDGVDAQGDPAAAERKRRRAAVPGNSPSAAEIGRDAGRAAHKKRAKHIHPPGSVVDAGDSAAGVGRPPEGRKSHSSSCNVGGVVDSAASVGRPLEGHTQH